MRAAASHLTVLCNASPGWLAAGPAGRHGLRSFVAWATERGLVRDVSVAARKPAQPSVFVDQAEQMRQLERCLGDDTMPLDPRVAGALILLFGINISPVLRIRQDQITGRDGTCLTLDRHELIIPPRTVTPCCFVNSPSRGAPRRSRRTRPRRSSCSPAGHSASPSLPARSAGDSRSTALRCAADATPP
jgi:hypothetical protein